MVAVHIFIEGIATNDSNDVNTVDRSTEFRRAFHKLFSQSIENELIELSIEPATSWKAAAKTYIRHKQKGDKNYCLLIDLDGTIDDTTKIYSMAGSEEQNPKLSTQELVELIKQVGRTPIERDTLYGVVKDYSEVVFN